MSDPWCAESLRFGPKPQVSGPISCGLGPNRSTTAPEDSR